MLFNEKLKKYLFLPVLLVALFLSIESVAVIVLEFIIISLESLDISLLSFSDELLSIVTLILAKGISLVFLAFLINKKLQDDELEPLSEFNFGVFLIVTILVYVGCTSFLMANLKNSLFIYSDRASTIELWPKIVLSRAFIDYIDYQLFLILLLLVVSPIFEELLFRKAVILALFKRRLGSGWIIVISSLIYAIPSYLTTLVEYSEEQAFWSFNIQLGSGLILAFVFLRTQNIKYPVLLKFLLNLTIYFHFLTLFHPIISPFREYFLISLTILSWIGIVILIFFVLKGAATIWKSPSAMSPWLHSFLDFRFSSDSQLPKLILAAIFLLPLIPLGLVLFIDHTILYNDFQGSLIKTVIKSLFLGAIVLFCGIQIKLNTLLFKACSEPNSSLRPIIQGYYLKIRNNYRTMIKEAPRVVFRHFGILFLFLGAVSPFLYFSAKATMHTTILIFEVAIEMTMTSGQNPFLSFSQISLVERPDNPLIQPMTEEIFYFLKHTDGQWYFLPDSFMSHPDDWFRGLITVGIWFLFFILLFFALYEYLHNRKIIAGVLVISVIIIEALWWIVVMGEPTIFTVIESAISQIADRFPFVQVEYELSNFFILPLGLVFFLLAALIFLYSGFKEYFEEKKIVNHVSLDRNNSEDTK